MPIPISCVLPTTAARWWCLPLAIECWQRQTHTDRELVVAYYDAARIDLGEMIREQLFLGLPMKRLCSEGCQGLCPSCGVDRNASSCQCVPEDEHVSSPFSKLTLKGPNS